MNLTHYLSCKQLIRPMMDASEFTPEEEAILSQHVQWLHRQAEQGVLIFTGRTLNTDERALSIMIFKAKSLEEAEALMNSDPAVKQGVMRTESFPFQIHLLKESNV